MALTIECIALLSDHAQSREQLAALQILGQLEMSFSASRIVPAVVSIDPLLIDFPCRGRSFAREESSQQLAESGGKRATDSARYFLFANPCAGVEFPARVDGLFRPHYVTWSEQQKIEFAAPEYLRNVIRIVTETGLRIYKELTPMKKDQLDLVNRTVWIPDSKMPNGVAEVPLTDIAVAAFTKQLAISGPGEYLFPSDENASGHQKTFKTAWHATLRRAKVPYFRIYDLRSTYATRLSAGGVADEWVTQLLRQGDAKVFKKYSQMKLQMKREALAKLNRQANETGPGFGTAQGPAEPGFWHSFGTVEAKEQRKRWSADRRSSLEPAGNLVGAV